MDVWISFIFNCYRYFSLLDLQNGNVTSILLRNREGMVQGEGGA